MPVQGGYGQSTLDYIGCHNGRFFSIETKAPGKKPTDRQNMIIDQMNAAGGKTFVIDGDLEELEEWLYL
jgi:penicillin-binding protein-related factor A (putative recombinase)